MLLCVNGLIAYVDRKAPYPENIIDVAERFDLLDHIKISATSYITKGNAAVLMFNALISKTYEIGVLNTPVVIKTLMDKLYGFKLMRGIMTGNGASQLDKANGSVSKNSVTVEGIMYNDVSGQGI